MKILVDQNISFRVIPHLLSTFGDVQHVKTHNLLDTNDHDIFKYARANGFDGIITMDDDFQNILLERGTPPKIIWIRTGNCSTAVLIEVLLNNISIIKSFMANEELDSLEIFK